MPYPSIDARLAAYARRQAERQAGHERSGPFVARFDPDSAHPYLNYAVPDDDAAPSAGQIDQLVELFVRRRRMARVEYFPGAAPGLAEALLANGFDVEREMPVLCCSPGQRRVGPTPGGVDLVVVRPEVSQDVAGTALVASIAFGEDPPDRPALDRLRRALIAGGGAVLARDAATAEPLGSAQCTPPVDGVGEVVGVGVVPGARRRGIALALTSALLAPGVTPSLTLAWLSPESGGAESAYRAVGFTLAASTLHLSVRHTGPAG